MDDPAKTAIGERCPVSKNGKFWNWFDTEARPKLVTRADTFAKMFEYLDRFDRPVSIVETGCVRNVGN